MESPGKAKPGVGSMQMAELSQIPRGGSTRANTPRPLWRWVLHAPHWWKHWPEIWTMRGTLST